MPQLDFSTFYSQIFWLCICFFSMLFIMAKFITPRITEMINLRKDKIDDYLGKAEAINQKAEKALDKYNQALKTANDNANQSLLKTQQDLKNLIERKQAELTTHLNEQIAVGENKICLAKEKALQQVEAMSQDLALEVLHKLDFKYIDKNNLQVKD